jgi:hypothetical protein
LCYSNSEEGRIYETDFCDEVLQNNSYEIGGMVSHCKILLEWMVRISAIVLDFTPRIVETGNLNT